MEKSKFFTVVITIVVSAAILMTIINIIFDNSKINQGNFRISDTVLSSIIELEDKSEGNNGWTFDVSQSNKISMLVTANSGSKIKEVYLEKVAVSSKKNVNIYLEQEKYDVNYHYAEIKNKKVNIYTEEQENGSYLVEFDILNKDILSDYIVPDEIKEIRHDGTILNLAGIAISDITFNLKYNLVVVEQTGQINTCKIKISMPDKKLATEGLSVERLSNEDFNFKVEYWNKFKLNID